MKLPISYFQSNDVVSLAEQLLGKLLVTNINGIYTGGIIAETEAYAGIFDKASHAYRGKRTKRNEVMYNSGGYCYVFLCYGIHHLFNIVTGVEGTPTAILIRSIHPTVGIQEILKRRKKTKLTSNLTVGPGKVAQALGINMNHNKVVLSGNKIWIEETSITPPKDNVIKGKRVGIDYSGEDADLLYRFELII